MSRVRTVTATLAVLASLAIVAVLGGCARADAGAAPAPAPVASQPVASRPASAQTSLPGPAPLPASADVSVSSVTIKAIGVHTTKLETLALLGNGELAAPRDPDRAGWFSGGTVPGQVGPAVIAGHVDSTTGPAVFYDLRRLTAGDRVTVGLSNGKSATFAVDEVVTTKKDGFPTDRVFGPTPDRELRLITCGGPYDRSAGGYLDNTIVFATAV